MSLRGSRSEREGIVPPPIPPLPGLPRRLAPIPGVLPVPASPEPSDFLPDAETDLVQAAGSPAAEEGCDDVQVAHGASEDQPLPSSLSQAQPLTRAERLERRLQQKEKQQLEQRRRLDGSGSKDTQSPWTTPLAVRPLARSAASGMRHERCGSPRRKSALASELIAGIAPPSSRYRAPLNERNGSAILQDLFQVGTLRFAPPKEVATSSNLPSIQVVPPTSPQPPTSAPLSPQQIDPLTPDDLSRSPARRPLKRVKVNQLGEPVKRCVRGAAVYVHSASLTAFPRTHSQAPSHRAGRRVHPALPVPGELVDDVSNAFSVIPLTQSIALPSPTLLSVLATIPACAVRESRLAREPRPS